MLGRSRPSCRIEISSRLRPVPRSQTETPTCGSSNPRNAGRVPSRREEFLDYFCATAASGMWSGPSPRAGPTDCRLPKNRAERRSDSACSALRQASVPPTLAAIQQVRREARSRTGRKRAVFPLGSLRCLLRGVCSSAPARPSAENPLRARGRILDRNEDLPPSRQAAYDTLPFGSHKT